MMTKCMREGCEHQAQVALPAKIGPNGEKATLYLCNEHYFEITRGESWLQPESVSMEVIDRRMNSGNSNKRRIIKRFK